MEKGLFSFERVHLERLKLACEVLLEVAEDDWFTDVLETELRDFKEQVEHILLLPDRHAKADHPAAACATSASGRGARCQDCGGPAGGAGGLSAA